jgi:hypothetical protein
MEPPTKIPYLRTAKYQVKYYLECDKILHTLGYCTHQGEGDGYGALVKCYQQNKTEETQKSTLLYPPKNFMLSHPELYLRLCSYQGFFYVSLHYDNQNVRATHPD